MSENKEKKDILLIPQPYKNSFLEEENYQRFKKVLEERTSGKVWVAKFDKEKRVIRCEHPKGREYFTSENGKWVTYSKSLYMSGDSGLLEPNFKLLKCFGAVVGLAHQCPQEDSRIQDEPLLTIPPTLVIGSCTCTPRLNQHFNTTLYTIGYRKDEDQSRLCNDKGNRVAPIRSIDDMADVATGLLLNNEAIQEKAASRLAKLEADYQTLTNQWKRQ